MRQVYLVDPKVDNGCKWKGRRGMFQAGMDDCETGCSLSWAMRAAVTIIQPWGTRCRDPNIASPGVGGDPRLLWVADEMPTLREKRRETRSQVLGCNPDCISITLPASPCKSYVHSFLLLPLHRRTDVCGCLQLPSLSSLVGLFRSFFWCLGE